MPINLFKNKRQEDFENFFFYLEKVCNVTLQKVIAKNNVAVKITLNEIESIFYDFFELRRSNFKNFFSLFYSNEFYEKNAKKYIYKGKFIPKYSDDSISYRTDKGKETILTLSGFDRELKGLKKIIKYLKDIWEVAFANNNTDITAEISNKLINILLKISEEDEYELFLEEFLSLQITLSRKVIDKSKTDLDRSIYYTSIYWYFIVYTDSINTIRQLSYLETFDKYFIHSIKFVINNELDPIFKVLIRMLNSSIITNSFSEIRYQFGNYSNLINLNDSNNSISKDDKDSLNRILNELENSRKILYTEENIEKCLKNLDDMHKDVKKFNLQYPNINVNELFKKTYNEIFLIYKFHNLYDIVFSIGAYCVYEKNFDFIKKLWECLPPFGFKKGDNFSEFKELKMENILFNVFRKPLFQQYKYHLTGEPSTDELFLKKYFLLILLKSIKKKYENYDDFIKNLDFSFLEEMDIDSLYRIKNNYDHLVSIIEFLIVKDKDFLLDLGFNEQEIEHVLKNVIKDFLNKLQIYSENEINQRPLRQQINKNCVTKFYKQCLFFYKHERNIINIFKKMNEETVRLSKITFEKNNIVKNEIKKVYEEKIYFIDSSTNSFGNIGSDCIKELFRMRNTIIVEEIITNCMKSKISELNNIIKNNLDSQKFIMILINDNPKRIFKDDGNYIKGSNVDYDKMAINKLNLTGFCGYYDINKMEIPIFEVNTENEDKNILILNIEKFGVFIQYISEDDKIENEKIQDIPFVIDIKAFSEEGKDNGELMNSILSNPSQDLKKLPLKERKQHLRKCIWLRIFETFEFKIAENFEGYIFLPEK